MIISPDLVIYTILISVNFLTSVHNTLHPSESVFAGVAATTAAGRVNITRAML